MRNSKSTVTTLPQTRQILSKNYEQFAQQLSYNHQEQQYEQRDISLPPHICDHVGFLRSESQSEPTCHALKISDNLILAPSLFRVNMKTGAKHQQLPRYPEGQRYEFQHKNKKVEIGQWEFLGEIRQNQSYSVVLALAKVQIQPLNYFQYFQFSNDVALGQTIYILGTKSQSQNVKSEANLKQGNQPISYSLGKIVNINNSIIEYKLSDANNMGLLSGAPIIVQTANGFRLIGLHLRPSLDQQSDYYGIRFPRQLIAALQKFKLKCSREVQMDSKLSPFLNQVKPQGSGKTGPEVGRYLIRQHDNKKVQIFNSAQNLTILLQDHTKNMAIYSKVTKQHLQKSEQLVSRLDKIYNMLEYQLQRQNETLDHIFRLDEGGKLELKLQNEPKITIKLEAKCSTKGLTHIQAHQLTIQKIKQQINVFTRDRFSHFSQLVRQLQERIKLKFISCQLQLEKIMERANGRIEASITRKTDSLTVEILQNIQREIQKHFDYYKFQRDESKNSAELKQQLKSLSESMRKQKQEVKQLVMSTREIDRKFYESFQEIKLKMEGEAFGNQMSFARLEEINAMLSGKLQKIEQQFAIVKRQEHSATNHTLIDSNNESISESGIQKSVKKPQIFALAKITINKHIN